MSHLKEKILVEGGKESPLAAHEMQMLAVTKASSINMGASRRMGWAPVVPAAQSQALFSSIRQARSWLGFLHQVYIA